MDDHAHGSHDDHRRHHHHHGHHHGGGEHGHTHGVIDPSLATTERGLWAVKWSFIGLMITAVLQVGVVYISGSVALFADTIHNFGDAATAIPLGIAFMLARLPATRRFPYGYGRSEDLAGMVIVAIILFSACVAGYEAINRIYHPRPIDYLGAVCVASIIGFLGNEAVAVFRIRVGRQINSVALIADGYHARTDGWTSLAVLAGALGVWWGYPLADPVIGLLITLAILVIVWQSARAVLTRMLDGVDPQILDEIAHAAGHVDGIKVSRVRARWIGHRLHVDLGVVLEGHLDAHEATHRIEHVQEEVRDHVAGTHEVIVTLEHGEEEPHDATAGGHSHPA